MQYRNSIFAAATLVGSSLAAYIPSEPWSTLTPDESYPSGATTDYTATFGIAVVTLSASDSSATSTAIAKRDVISQIADGQIQATTSTASSTKATSTAQVVSQIGDGQIQATTSTATPSSSSSKVTSTAQVVSQIGDGQIQATTSTATTTSSSVASTSTAQVVSQIGDGQIQATTSTATEAATSTATVVSQISDGQIQATSSTSGASETTLATSTVDSDSSSSASSSSSSSSSTSSSSVEVDSVACLTDSSLALTLSSSILTDAAGRIGSIVANRQFQFDGPPPQAGAIYAAGWSVTEDGYLALGNSTSFYQCLSGTFYNLYDESIGAQCTEIQLEIVNLVSC